MYVLISIFVVVAPRFVKRYKLCSTPLAPNQATVSKMQNTELMYFEWFILSVIFYF